MQPPVVSHLSLRLQQPYVIPMDSNPLRDRMSAAETEAIFDEILTQLNDASNDLEHFDGGHISRARGAEKRMSGEVVNQEVGEGANRDSTGGANRDSTEGTILEAGEEETPDTDPQGSVILRSPKHRAVQANADSPNKPRSSSVTVIRKSATPESHTRKMSLPEGLPPLLGASSSDTIPASTSSSSMSLDILRNLSTLPGRPHPSANGGSELDPTTKALKLIVCMSRNKECLTTLVSYLCLPKFMAQ